MSTVNISECASERSGFPLSTVIGHPQLVDVSAQLRQAGAVVAFAPFL